MSVEGRGKFCSKQPFRFPGFWERTRWEQRAGKQE
jgi:hypothetical protein